MDFSELIAAADPSVFTESISAWISGISINSVIMMIMMIYQQTCLLYTSPSPRDA